MRHLSQGVSPNGEYPADTDLTDNLVNLTNEVQTIQYTFKARIRDNRPGAPFGYCNTGGDTTLTIYLNPTPRMSVSVADTILCDSTALNITVDDNLLGVQGLKVYELTTTFNPLAVEGVTASGEFAAGTDLTDNLVNLTNEVQTIQYTFKARIRDTRPGAPFGYCDTGGDTTLTIYLNPTPRMSVSVADTILCDSTALNITVNDDLLGVQGLKVYELTTTYDAAGVAGVSPNGEYPADTDLTDNLVNLTNEVQTIQYTFKARIRDNRPGAPFGYCNTGGDTTLTIYLNPTPRMSVSVADTILCDSTALNITVDDNLLGVQGLKVYELTTTFNPLAVEGVTASGEFAAGTDLTDNLVNLTNEVQTIQYTFKARIRDTRPGAPFGYCDTGGDTTLTIYLNPTPRMSVSVADTILCDSTALNITVNDDLLGVQGLKVYELTTTYDAAGVAGVSPNGEYPADTDLTDNLVNLTNEVQTIQYTFKARIRDNRPGAPFGYCDTGGDTTLTIYLNPTPRMSVSVADTILCDSTALNITVDDNLLGVQGLKVYELTTTFNPLAVEGVTASGEFAAGTDLTDNLVNLTNEVQTIQYTFKARIRDTRPGAPFGYCDTGGDTTLTIYLNPTPRITIIPEADTLCFNEGITFNVSSANPNVEGLWVYDVEVTAPLGIINASGNTSLSPGLYDQSALRNIDTMAHTVIYRFIPRISGINASNPECNNGIAREIRVIVNPQPRIFVEFSPDTILCHNEGINFSVTTGNGPVQGNWVYDVIISNISSADSISGESGSNDLDNAGYNQNLINISLGLQWVEYTFRPKIRNVKQGTEYCSGGVDSVIRVYINPQPAIFASANPDTIICYDEGVDFDVQDSNTSYIGDWVYDVQTAVSNIAAFVNVSNGNDLDLLNYPQNTVMNISDSLQYIDYTFIPKIKNPRPGREYCSNGKNQIIRVWVNPRAKIQLFVADTIFCDTSEVVFNLSSLNGNILGDKIYRVEIDYPGASVSSTYAEGEYYMSDIDNFADNLVNNTDSLVLIKYTIRPGFRNPRGDDASAYCLNGVDTSLTIYLNPTPKILVLPQYDIYCDSSQILVQLSSLNPTHTGEKYFYLETSSTGTISGASPDGYYPLNDIMDFLVNNEHDYKNISYTLTPAFRDYRNLGITSDYCGRGKKEIFTLSINPTPVLEVMVPVEDTVLCNNTQVEFTFANDQVFAGTGFIGYKLNTQYSDVSGVKADSDNITLISFTDNLENLSDSIKEVIYTFTPVIYEARPGFNCDRGVKVNVPVKVVPELYTVAQTDTFVGNWTIQCYGFTTDLDLTVHGGYYLQPYQYTWDKNGVFPLNPSNPEYLSSLDSGQYNINVTDILGCTYSDSYELTHPPDVVITETIQQQSCGPQDGAITINVVGGTPGYTYFWDGPETFNNPAEFTLQNISGLRFGGYDLSVKDTNNCNYFKAYYLTQPVDITVTLNQISEFGDYNIRCVGEENGYLSVKLNGGSGNVSQYLYFWDEYLSGPPNPAFTVIDSAWNLRSGYYALEVEDELGCKGYSAVYYVSEPPPIEISRSGTQQNPPFDVSCFGSDDAIINLNITGGHTDKWPLNINYDWTRDGDPMFTANTKNLSSLAPDTYNISLTDFLGCASEKSFEIIQPDLLELDTLFISDYNGYQVSCFGSDNSKLDLQVRGGYNPGNIGYSYEWTTTDGSLTSTSNLNQEGLPAGNYSLKVTDIINCSMSWNFEILQPDTLNILPVLHELNGYEISCYDGSDGSIELNTFGGVAPYSFSWDGEGTVSADEDQYNLQANTYRVSITDDNACTAQWEFILTQPDQLKTTLLPVPVNCFGFNNGAIDLTVTGGVQAYEYLWSNGAQTEDLNSILMGLYSVEVRDANSCIVRDSIEITEPPEINIEFTIPEVYNGRMISCHGESDADIFTQVTGGYGAFEYLWISRPERVAGYPDNIPEQLNVSAGQYVLRVIDENDCEMMDSIIVLEPSRLVAEIYPNNPSCFGYKDGNVNLIVFGATPAYTIDWIGIDQTGSIASNLGAGEYQVSIKDLNNCHIDTFAILTQPDTIRVSKQSELPFCFDTNDGRIELTSVTGGTMPYNIIWQDGTEGYYLDAIGEGVYIVKIHDNNRCEYTDTTLLGSLNKSCLIIPTAFTPNGDGYNDTWEIGNIEIYPEARVEIYNRWGELLFVSGNGYEVKWDGTHKGRDLPIDSYHYIITLKKGREPVVGIVTIIK
jgi:gliding motility-associated-like protein